MKFNLLLPLVSCQIFGLALTRADVAPNPLSGGISLQTTGRESTEIALRHNTVKIKVTPQLCTTRAFFRLHNTGAATTLEVGFPLMYQGESKDFQLFIDDKAATFRDQTEQVMVPIKGLIPRYWKAWNMKFEAGQTQLVEVRYSNPPSRGVSSNLEAFVGYDYNRYDNYEPPTDYQMADYGYPRRVMSSELAKLSMMEYILVTGSYWKGPIERCRVEVDIEELAFDAISDVFPPAKSVTARRILWSWTNVEPPRNIQLIFLKDSPLKIISYWEKIAKQHPSDLALRDNLALLKTDFQDEAKVRERQKKFVEG